VDIPSVERRQHPRNSGAEKSVDSLREHFLERSLVCVGGMDFNVHHA
jgi:hypothetical protein